MRSDLRPSVAFLLGGSLFVALFLASEALLGHLDPLDRNVLFKLALAVTSLLWMLWSGRGFRSFGFQRTAGVRWRRVVGSGFLLGALATVAILASPAAGHPLLQGASLPQIVLTIWIWSSLTEEIFTRGLVQGLIREPQSAGPEGSGLFRNPRVVTSALLFGAMHLTLLWSGADAWTSGILLLATTALGFLAAAYREASGSLLPAIINHVCFNIGGLLGGILWVVGSRFM